MKSLEEQNEELIKRSEYIFRESLKVNEECKEALCRIERRIKKEKKEVELDYGKDR